MSPDFDIAVVGGGMVGLALARLLITRERRLRLVVVDAGAAPEFDADSDVALRVSAISPGSTAILDECGVWSGIHETRASPYERMCVWDARGDHDAPGALDFSADELGLPFLGHIVENELIRSHLYEMLQPSGTRWEFGRRLSAIDPGRHAVTITLDNGTALRSRLVVGADGARSAVRELSGLESRRWRYPQDALVTHVRSEQPHEQTAWQRFLPSGPIALLPLADGRCSVVWSTDTETCRELYVSDDDSLGLRLTEATAAVLGRLQLEGPRGSFPLAASYAPSYVAPRVVLAGDAAHSVHPLAGQGVNLGFGDARELASCISAAASKGEDPGDRPVLRRYERARKGENMRTLLFLDSLQRFFGVDSAFAATLRMSGMRVFNRLGPLKRMAVQHATGLREITG